MSAGSNDEILWRHAHPQMTQIFEFMQEVNQEKQLRLKTFQDLYDYSITQSADFWSKAFKYVNLVHEGDYTQVVDLSAPIDSVPEWFQGVSLNFAENLLYSGPIGSSDGGRSTTGKEDSKVALTEVTEAEGTSVNISWARLRSEVVQMAAAMRANGVRRGDRVAVVSGNSYNTLKVFLGVTAIGGIFSSTSPDMGVKAQLDRLLQLKPTLTFCDDAARYNGKTVDLCKNIVELIDVLGGNQKSTQVVVMPRFANAPLDISNMSKSVKLVDFLGAMPDDKAVAVFKFERVPFKAPFLIAYSSGTTGKPKCIVHSVGGVLLASSIHNTLHIDQRSTDTVLQFTTTGWIMYLLQVVHLIHGARIVLYDGSPFHPDMKAYLRLISREKVTMLGTSPKWLSQIQKHEIYPRDLVDLSSLKVLASTGSVLSDSLFRWIYQKGFPPTVQLENVSGGTDIAGAFACGNPLDPVHVGGMQGPPLGVSVSIFEEREGEGLDGHFALPGTAGELVVARAFPNMPTSFWGPDGKEKYFKSYFEKFNGVWTQGDNVVALPGTRLNFLGRSDGVLNPAGIRFGASEIYAVLEQNFPQIEDSVVVGQRRPLDADERVVLFLMMSPNQKYTRQLVEEVKQAIRRSLTSRHVPAFIFETPDIPRTINMKKAELPVKKILCGSKVKPSSTLVNPECLDYFYPFVNIEKMASSQSKL